LHKNGVVFYDETFLGGNIHIILFGNAALKKTSLLLKIK